MHSLKNPITIIFYKWCTNFELHKIIIKFYDIGIRKSCISFSRTQFSYYVLIITYSFILQSNVWNDIIFEIVN